MVIYNKIEQVGSGIREICIIYEQCLLLFECFELIGSKVYKLAQSMILMKMVYTSSVKIRFYGLAIV